MSEKKDSIGTCAECGKLFPLTELYEFDGDNYCEDCIELVEDAEDEDEEEDE